MSELPEGAEWAPIRLGVVCDGCGTVWEGDFHGHTLMDRDERLGMVLSHVEHHEAWQVISPDETYCSACRIDRKGQLAELQADLDRLEAVDPDVAAGDARYDAMSADLRRRRRRGTLRQLTREAVDAGLYETTTKETPDAQ